LKNIIELVDELEDLAYNDPLMLKLCGLIRKHPKLAFKLTSVTKSLDIIHKLLKIMSDLFPSKSQKREMANKFAIFTFNIFNQNKILDLSLSENDFWKVQYKNIIRKQFDRINPFLDTFENDDTLGEHNIINQLEDLYENVLNPYENDFIVSIDGNLLLGRAAKIKNASYERLTPTSKFKSLNRWNPDERSYAYLGFSRDQDKKRLLKTCIEEIRCSQNCYFSFCEFEFRSNNLKLLDLSLPYYQTQNLEKYVNDYCKKESRKIIKNFELKEDCGINEIKRAVESSSDLFRKDFMKLVAKEYLNYLVKEIFIPLDQEEDTDVLLKQKEYGSFHELALALETKYNGIIYPSTRMKLVGDKGECCVIFNHSNITPVRNTLKSRKK